ncbi:MAG TPA: carboxypeptidase-like regulatory domain-containing protein [Thermoanaerobaculia bacterium]|nr:carboxypeptidase-like regulatory domain-containing protein [Thermoanaerobaculia bacterium]
MKTGSNGAFSFPVQEGGIYRLSAEKDGYGGVRRAEPLRVREAALSAVELRLHRPASFSGRVLGLTDKELAGLALTLHGGHIGADGELKREGGGRYRVSDLPPGEWTLVAETGDRSTVVSATLAEGETKVLDVVFPPLSPVRGRVLGMDGSHVAGALVLCPGAKYEQGRTESGKDGRFVSLAAGDCVRIWARIREGAWESART